MKLREFRRKWQRSCRSKQLVIFGSVLAISMTGCQADLPPTKTPPAVDFAPVDRVLELMQKRLLLMHDVARWKWNERKPISDPDREQQLLEGIVTQANKVGLDPDWTRSFFAAQIEAAKVVQQADFDRWKSSNQDRFVDAPELAVLRKQIDQINIELLAELEHAVPVLTPNSMTMLERHLEERLQPGLDRQECSVAAAPLRKLIPQESDSR